jgi:VanZ family protein
MKSNGKSRLNVNGCMLKLSRYFDIKWLTLAAATTTIVILLSHIPEELMPSQLQESGLDKLEHGVAYGAITFFLILSARCSFSLRLASLVLFVLLAIGIVDEITQPLVRRQASPSDLVADVVGIALVLLLSIVAKHQLQRAKTEPTARLCFTAAVAFVTGVLVVPAISISVGVLTRPNLFQRQQAARYFFYSTMCGLFEGDYDPEEGSVSENALAAFKEYKPRFRDKCSLALDYHPYNQRMQRAGRFTGTVFFPSGDHFRVVIVRRGDRFDMERFEPWDWDLEWSETLMETERYYRLGYSPSY